MFHVALCWHSSSMTRRLGFSSFQQKRSPNTTKFNWISLSFAFFSSLFYHRLLLFFFPNSFNVMNLSEITTTTTTHKKWSRTTSVVKQPGNGWMNGMNEFVCVRWRRRMTHLLFYFRVLSLLCFRVFFILLAVNWRCMPPITRYIKYFLWNFSGHICIYLYL